MDIAFNDFSLILFHDFTSAPSNFLLQLTTAHSLAYGNTESTLMMTAQANLSKSGDNWGLALRIGGLRAIF